MISDIQKLIEAGKKYLEVRIEILKLEIKEEVSDYFVKFTFLVTGVLFLLACLLFLALALAFYINELMLSSYLGFVIVGAVFFVLMVTLIALRNNTFMQKAFEKVIDFFIFD